MIRALTRYSTSIRGAAPNTGELSATELAAVVGGDKATKPAVPVKSSDKSQVYLAIEMTNVMISSF